MKVVLFEIDKALVLRRFDWERFIEEARNTLTESTIRPITITQLEFAGPEEELDVFSKVLNVKQLQLSYTHFFSLPIVFSDSSVYADFKDAATSTINDAKLKLMFMSEAKLHLTI